MLGLFFLTPIEIVCAFVGGVASLLGIGAKTNKRNPDPRKKKRRK